MTEKETLMVCVVLWSLIYISFVLLLNWISLTGQKTLMVCHFVLIDFVSDVITWCAFFWWDSESCQFTPKKILIGLCCYLGITRQYLF